MLLSSMNSDKYASDTQSPQNVRDLLIDSIDKATNNAYCSDRLVVLPIASQDIDFSDYLVRIKPIVSVGVQALKKSSALQSPEQLLVGPKLSQSLLCLADSGEIIQQIVQLDIVPKHAGQTLDSTIGYDKFTNIFDANKADALRRNWLSHPEKLQALFDQAVFLGAQSHFKEAIDMHGENIMIDEDLTPSIIDMAYMKDLQTDAAILSNVPKSYSERLHHCLRVILSTGRMSQVQVMDLPPEQKQSILAFEELLDDVQHAALQKLESGELAEEHPEWKGFAMVDDVKLVSLDDPPEKLKAALDEIYAQAVSGR